MAELAQPLERDSGRLAASTDRLRDAAGAFGDVGVFLPLALALVAVNGLNPTIVFGLAGLYYIASGWLYRIPMPVQPFKAVSAIAIAQGLSPGTIQGAALGMSAGLLLLSLGPLPRLLDRLFSAAVVRGIQLGLGIILATSALQLAARDPRLAGGPWLPQVALLVGVVAVAVLQLQARIPALLVVGALGLAWGIATAPSGGPAPALGPVLGLPGLPTMPELATAIVVLVLPQLPLTLGNSIVSTADVAGEYFGERAGRVTHRRLLRDMGVANAIAGIAGGIPMCHGAGGMTAHVRFGARTWFSMVIAGAFYLGLGLGLGAAAPVFLAVFPVSVLGVLVGYVGWQHMLLVRRLKRRSEYAIAGLVGLVTLLTGSLALGFGFGLAADWASRPLRGRTGSPSEA
ncbi:MAG TPA: putative sulfate/molybdate transporter [Candidatus Limnocylindrales bacterium]|jgi:hypothetical protein|nr:putative sulfate/molybdate transporter [Candidatus Limnocylindrales bacterium]